jgi:hypothetical protein
MSDTYDNAQRGGVAYLIGDEIFRLAWSLLLMRISYAATAVVRPTAATGRYRWRSRREVTSSRVVVRRPGTQIEGAALHGLVKFAGSVADATRAGA